MFAPVTKCKNLFREWFTKNMRAAVSGLRGEEIDEFENLSYIRLYATE